MFFLSFFSHCCAAFAGCVWTELHSDASVDILCFSPIGFSLVLTSLSHEQFFWIWCNFINELKWLALKGYCIHVRMKKALISASSHLLHLVVIWFWVSTMLPVPKLFHPLQPSSFHNGITFLLVRVFFIFFLLTQLHDRVDPTLCSSLHWFPLSL